MNKEVNLKVKVDEARTVRYFQPVITNNTVIIPAKRLQDDFVSEKDEISKKMEEVKAELVQSVKEEIASINNIDNTSLGENKIDELKIEEIVIEEDANAISEQVENREECVEEEEGSDYKIKLEDMAKLFEKNQAEAVNKMDMTNAYSEEALQKDFTYKMDLPFLENEETESIPQRREMVDNLSEMKSKLFLLASNAKRPVRICVNKKVFLMGSDYAKMDCVIRNNRYISRCHAKIYYESACFFIEDAGSMNGTFINGVKLAEGIKYKLETGDVINLADCKFEVDIKN